MANSYTFLFPSIPSTTLLEEVTKEYHLEWMIQLLRFVFEFIGQSTICLVIILPYFFCIWFGVVIFREAHVYSIAKQLSNQELVKVRAEVVNLLRELRLTKEHQLLVESRFAILEETHDQTVEMVNILKKRFGTE